MKNLKVIICSGLPASGKSTWAKEHVRKNENFIRVSRDDFRSMLVGQQFCEPKIESMINSLQDKAIISALKHKCNVVIDNTNVRRDRVEHLVALVEYLADVEFRVFDMPLKNCLEINSKRENPVPDSAIKAMNEDFMILKDTYPFQNQKKKNLWDMPRPMPEINPELPTAVIFDLDGTLAYMGKRGPYDMDLVDRDDINPFVAEHTHFHRQKGRQVIIVSGRNESCRQMTTDWLDFYGVHYDLILMRADDDIRKDNIIKKEIYYTHIKDKYNVWSVYDDRVQVLEMWHKLGIFTYNVNQENLEF